MKKEFFPFILIVAVLLTINSCVSATKVRRSSSWYVPKALDSLPSISLAGKKILIDPGHGGPSSGSVGFFNTKEKDVNLIVAQNLKTLLQKRGALVSMTREADTSSLWPSTVSGREELKRRCRLRDSLLPDLFVSIHHNGSDDGSRDINVPKTFYAMTDAGASLDAANFINREFSEVLGLGPGFLQGGNFFVLRNPCVPSLIGEPSYLSHPEMERLLSDTAALQLEAAAYFRGIVRWFAQGTPKITGFAIDSLRGMITAKIESDVPLDPFLTGMEFQGKRLNGRIENNGFTAALGRPLSNGIHTVRCFAGNRSGNLGITSVFSFTVDRPAETLFTTIDGQSIGSLTRLQVTVLDNQHLPVKDMTLVSLKGQGASLTKGGIALFYVPVAETTTSAFVACGRASIHADIPAGKRCKGPFQGFVISSDSIETPLSCLISVSGETIAADENGFFSITRGDTLNNISAVFAMPGFLDTTVNLSRKTVHFIRLAPRARGVLRGKKIIIDPEFGGAEPGGISAIGTRVCDVTRKIGAITAGLLRQYGGEVSLAREEDRTAPATERVFVAENNAADVYIAVRSDSVGTVPYVSYLSGSEMGQKIAERMARQWSRTSGDSTPIREEHNFVLQHTPCPAITVSFCPLHSAHVLDFNKYRTIAQTLLEGLVDYYSGQSEKLSK
jgi:N-acetylmuramoyl-L-alanine amidase